MKKTILIIFITVSTLFAETANFKQGAFGCKNSDDIKGFWRAYKSGKTATYRFMFQNGCAFLPTDGWEIVETGYITNKVCSDDGYRYWVEKEFFKGEVK